MFKNLILYRITSDWTSSIAEIETMLERARFVECGASQEQSIGWVEPRGEKHGALVESANGHWLLKLMTEVKILPASVVKAEAAKRIESIEASTGRKPGKKESREIREDVHHELLPMAFTKRSATFVWIDPVRKLLSIDASSQSKADVAATALVRTLDGLALTLLQTEHSATASMSTWLTTQEAPAGFTADRDCVLKATDESKASIRYAKHPLDIEEVRQHIAAGKLPTQLAMTWEDKVSFVLTDKGQIKRVELLDGVMDGLGSDAKEGSDSFDADAVISTGTLRDMIGDLVTALGGETRIEA